MKRILALLLCLLLLLASAQAELKRNSRGDEVEQLQQMLTDLGFLNDKIDGIFGRKTEAAVKAVQDYFGEKQTGIYDDALDMKLLDLWGTVMGIMEGDGLDPEELQEIYPASCGWGGDEGEGAHYCWRHLEQAYLSAYTGGDAPEELERLISTRQRDLWLQSIDDMYTEWEDSLPEDDGEIASKQREIFEQALSENLAEWAQEYSELKALTQEARWLESIGVDLCFDLYGAEAN